MPAEVTKTYKKVTKTHVKVTKTYKKVTKTYKKVTKTRACLPSGEVIFCLLSTRDDT